MALTDALKAIEGYLAAKADQGDTLAAGLRQQMLLSHPDAAPDASPQATVALADEAPIVLDLNVFDEGGQVCDGTTVTLTRAQCSDIVDHAAQIILLRRELKDLHGPLDELDEALTVAGVLEVEVLG
ncbi:MAG: hypothetical protein O9327_02145 [Polaromonas sp.]|nr:hypothetical protein [Polaromonas sp.]